MFLGDTTTQPAEYYGPPQPGQTFEEYETYMNTQNAVIGSGILAAALFVNPIIAAGAAAAWLMSGPQKTKRKSQTQGG